MTELETREVERELGDRYQIVRALGRGAFGAVYLARERLLHRMVAIKVLHAERAWSDEERERLLREARTIANLSHPAIIPLLAFGETPSTVFMVMPYVGGETLADVLARDGSVSATEARRILIEITDALGYAHSEGVLHRDLKPENVLLERASALGDSMPPRVRLIDFGVAAFPMRDAGVNARHETWGTAEFMAPEQAFGEPELDPRSEIYSIGVLGYLLLAGRLPFTATSPMERIRQQQRGPAIPLADAAPNTPADLVTAIERCLAYEPERRWHRTRELRDALVVGAGVGAASDAASALVRRRLAGRGRGHGAALAGTVANVVRRAAIDRSSFAAFWTGTGADLRFAARTLAKIPGFTMAIIFTLAIGIGATTAIFSGIEALILRRLPVSDQKSLVIFQEKREHLNVNMDFGASLYRYDRYLAYREAVRDVVSGLAAQEFQFLSARQGNQARSEPGMLTSGNYFAVLGVHPALGRFYDASQDDGHATPVVVVGWDYWRREMGGRADAIGRKLWVDSRPLTVIGVAPRGFRGAFAGIFALDLWIPEAAYAHAPEWDWMNVFGRLRPGTSVATASAVVHTVAPRVAPEDPRTVIADAWVEPMSALPRELAGPVASFLTMLFGVATLVLIVAATNVAGMLLARAAGRRREVATRLAVGATRARVVRQLVIESVLLGVLGGVGGVISAALIARGLDSWQVPFPVPVAIDFSLDGAVLALALITVLGTGLLTGIVPAIQGSGVDLATAMKEGGLQGGPRRARLRSALVVAQVAVSVVLLAVAGLFVRSFDRALHVDPGFDASNVAHAGIGLAPHGYDAARARAFDAQLLARLRARPEIAAASIGNNAPLGGSSSTWGATPTDRPDAQRVDVQWSDGDVGIIELLRTPLLAGRTFSAQDTKDAMPVTVINETLAERLWPRTPLTQVVGRRLHSRGGELTVVGVIGNGKYLLLQEEPRAFGWTPFAQSFSRTAIVFVRARGQVDAAIRALREEVARIDPNVALHGVGMLEGDVARQVIPQRIAALLVGVFGAAGLLLSVAGLYGVLAYAVTQRLREFGVRMALGAQARDVVRLMLRYGVGLVAAGLTIGLAGAVIAGRLVARFLYGIGAGDPVTLTVVPVTLLVVGLAACIVPARRAAAADPMTSLRAE